MGVLSSVHLDGRSERSTSCRVLLLSRGGREDSIREKYRFDGLARYQGELKQAINGICRIKRVILFWLPIQRSP